MTIGKNSRKSSVRSSIRAPKFLDKSSGFYGRLDEPEATGEGEEVRGNEVEERWNGIEDNNREGGVVSSPSPSSMHVSGADERGEAEAFDFNEGMMEGDGETLLRRKPSRRSSRWRRSSKRKQKEGRAEEDAARDERPSLSTDSPVLEDTRVIIEVQMETVQKVEEEDEKAGEGKEPALVHFTVQEDADDQVLIRDKKRGREEEGEEERRMKREQEEGMRVVKRNSVKNYRKALDRAFRRGWEAFIANLYSVTLTPVTSTPPPSSSPSSKKKQMHSSVLAEFH
ncbi:cilia- and flagella-associated protein 251 [Chelmon rostratus]|uniref:cilia- and flagella-associated protein 251 n=1 Tax=Chelmon rostratus TaxID=109905 RepID=UPI001BE9600E|nr:cilia- and flagella-associated protein 251 [Chelmon rostratus]